MDARKTSEFLALQIVANLRGVVPSFARAADGRIEAVGGADGRPAIDSETLLEAV